jgi:hypothetical protein
MSDQARNERRAEATTQSEMDTKERLVRLEAGSKYTIVEVERVRDRVHELVETLAPLVLLAEEAKETRDMMTKNLEKIMGKIDPIPVDHAKLAITVAAHVEQCTRDKAQTTEAITELKKTVEVISKTVWKAMGAATAFWLVITIAIAIWKR